MVNETKIFSESRLLLLASKNFTFDILKICYGMKIIKIYPYNSSKVESLIS